MCEEGFSENPSKHRQGVFERIFGIQLLNRRIILYLIFGFLTTLVNILSYIFFVDLCRFEYLFGNVLAWFVSVVFAYVTNRIWVFESKNKNIFYEFALFIEGRVFSGVLDTSLLFVFVSILTVNDLISKIIIGIIVDDGSKDNTLDNIKNYLKLMIKLNISHFQGI